MAQTVIRTDQTFKNQSGDVLGWMARDGKFYPSGVAMTADQMREILAMMAR